MLLLLFGVPSTGISVVIAEAGDNIVLRIASVATTIIDQNFRVVARPRRRTIIAASA
jgi:hypothetical protein